MAFTVEEMKKMTILNLKQIAKEMGLKNVSALKKDDLIEKILSSGAEEKASDYDEKSNEEILEYKEYKEEEEKEDFIPDLD